MQDQKLYVIVRGDLPVGAQAAQAVHAAFGFAQAHPELTRQWLTDSQYLVLLTVPDMPDLACLAHDAGRAGILRYLWREPDLGNMPTALVLEPGAASRRLTATYPLLGRDLAPA